MHKMYVLWYSNPAKNKMLVLIALLFRTNFEMLGQKRLVFDVIFFLELAAL